jgi:O-antigen/teichoic acid export membrane protein
VSVGRRFGSFGWGFVDQGLSSATTLLLTLVGGRAVGPAGLGVVVIGWTGYLLVLLFQRSLVTRPLVSMTAAAPPDEAHDAGRRALTATLCLGGVATVCFLVLGLAVPGDVGRGLLLFTPWVAVALLQEYWRALLFRDRRGSAAVANDATWFVVLCVLAAPAWALGSDVAVAAAWGAGAAAAALLGAFQTRIAPAALSRAWDWWRAAWPFSRWLGLEGVYYSACGAGIIVVLNSSLGATAVGGLRAAQSLFAPLTLITPAIALPGLPAMARAGAQSRRAAFSLARRLSGAVMLFTAVYVIIMTTVGSALLPLVFGDSFDRFRHLALPIGIWQEIGAAGVGFTLFLTAWQRGRDLFVARVVESTSILALVAIFVGPWGLRGATWAYVVGAALGQSVVIALAVRAESGREAFVPPQRGEERPERAGTLAA